MNSYIDFLGVKKKKKTNIAVWGKWGEEAENSTAQSTLSDSSQEYHVNEASGLFAGISKFVIVCRCDQAQENFEEGGDGALHGGQHLAGGPAAHLP